MEYQDNKQLRSLENDAITHFLEGDADSFVRLVELYKDRVHQFIICILGPDRESEDIAQEVFIQIYNSLVNFRRESAFGTWAYSLNAQCLSPQTARPGARSQAFQ